MPEQTIPERDRETCEHIGRALAAVQAALQSMPNSAESVFDVLDARRLSQVEQQIVVLAMAENDLQRAAAESDPRGAADR